MSFIGGSVLMNVAIYIEYGLLETMAPLHVATLTVPKKI